MRSALRESVNHPFLKDAAGAVVNILRSLADAIHGREFVRELRTMVCEIARANRVMFVLWGKPELSDFDAILDVARQENEAGGPFVFVARAPACAEAPSKSMRSEVSRCISQLIELCASYHGIIEGDGFTVSAKRAILATMFLLTRHRGKLHVHSSVKQVVTSVPLEMRADVKVALKEFDAVGLLRRNLESLRPQRLRAVARSRL